MRTLEFPESLEIIGREAFSGCSGLKGSIRIPNNVTQIKDRAFAGDSCKLKIDMNRQTKIQFASSDKDWVVTHVQAIKID